jgi:hypothetical protein
MNMSLIRERFDAVAKQYDAKIAALIDERSRMEQELRDARSKFNELMIQDVENPSKETATGLTKLTKQIDAIELELSLMDKRCEVVQNKKEQALKELFPELVKERDIAVEKARQAILEAAPELKKTRARILLQLKALHDMSVEARETHRELESIANALGVEFRARFELPSLPLMANHEGVHQNLIPLANEVMEAYRSGRVPYFVELYGKTGVMTDNDTARRELAKL